MRHAAKCTWDPRVSRFVEELQKTHKYELSRKFLVRPQDLGFGHNYLGYR